MILCSSSYAGYYLLVSDRGFLVSKGDGLCLMSEGLVRIQWRLILWSISHSMLALVVFLLLWEILLYC